jgi:hypothetical protein
MKKTEGRKSRATVPLNTNAVYRKKILGRSFFKTPMPVNTLFC